MAVKKWTDICARKFSAAELRQIDREVETELLEVDLRWRKDNELKTPPDRRPV